LNSLLNDYTHDYETICKAIAAGLLGTAHAMDMHKNAGITGFQASCVISEFIKHYMFISNETSMRIINYDNLIYPQYEHYFAK
jgi:hypothetical protein